MQTQIYVPTQHLDPFRSVGVGAAFFPPGINLPGAEGLDVFSEVMGQLQQLGLFTPWATRLGSMDWKVIAQPPDTNIAVGALDDSIYQQILGVGFGKPLPFIGVLTDKLPTPTQISDAFTDTSYDFYETQAVYSQADREEPPNIIFLHWLELRAPGDANGGGQSLSAAASRIGGRLAVMMQVGYTDTRQRDVPTVSFDDALNAQLGVHQGTTTVTTPGPDVPALPDESAASSGWGVYQYGVAAGIFALCALGSYIAYQAITRNSS